MIEDRSYAHASEPPRLAITELLASHGYGFDMITTCGHNVGSWRRVDRTPCLGFVDGGRIVRCFYCGVIQPLGAATDGILVLVEIRAAEIVLDGLSSASWDEKEGWDRHGFDSSAVNDPDHQDLELRGWVAERWAGWLAREISRTR